MEPRATFQQQADRASFGKAMAAMGAGLQRDVDEFTIGVYYRALRDVPLDKLMGACEAIVNTLDHYPQPVEWREFVDKLVEAEEAAFALEAPVSTSPQLMPGPEPEHPEPYYDCNMCEDTCWETFICDKTLRGDDDRTYVKLENGSFDYNAKRRWWCGRKDCRDGHEFVHRCGCYPNNPTWKRRNPPKLARYTPKERRQRGEKLFT